MAGNDLELALRIKADLAQGQKALEDLGAAVESVGEAAQASSTQLGQIGESADQQAARIRAMVEASLQQQAAADALASSVERGNTVAQDANRTWQQTATAQTEAMNAYHNAERAAEQKAEADARAAAAAAQAAAATEKEGQELQQLLGKIDPVIRRLDELDDMEQQLRRARASGQIDLDTFDTYNAKLQEQRQRLGGTTDAMRAASISAGQYQQAMRQLPMQITDITTSLASGMPVWMVAVQQGGQIKDSFGGWANAGRALVSTINPLTLAIAAVAAAVGGAALAYFEGSQEAVRFNEALILTGGYARMTAGDLVALAQQMDAMSGVTQSSASAALTQVVASGQFAGEQIELVAVATEQMRVATGRAIDQTIAEFAKLGDDPVEALLDLNDQYHFLSRAQLDQIRSLQDQGREQDAATEAMRLYADVIAERTPLVEQNLGSIERAWRRIKQMAGEAVDAALSIGRASPLADQIAEAEAELERNRNLPRRNFDDDYRATELENRIAYLRKQAAQQQQSSDESAAGGPAVDSDEERARIQQQERFDRYAENLRRQVDLHGEVSEAAKVRYAIEHGELGKLTAEQQAALVTDAEALDAKAAALDAAREAEAAAKRQTQQTEQLARQQQTYVAGLEHQAATIDMTAAEVRQYELAEKGLTGAMRARADAALALIDAAEAQRQADANARTNAGLEAEFLRASGRETDAALLEIRTKFAGMRTEFEKAGNEAGLAWLDKLIPVAEAKVRVDDVQREMDRILAEQQRQEQSVNVQQGAGLLSEVAARERILEIHKETYAQLQEMRPLLEEMSRMPGEVGLSAAAALIALDDQAVRLQATTSLLAETLSQGLEQGLSNALAGLAAGTMNLEDAILSLARTVVQAMAQMAANQLAQSAMSGLMGAFGGAAGAATGGGAGAAAGYVGAFGFAEGGKVKGPGTPTSDSILAALSTEEVVIRAASAMQPGATDFLLDFNARGMQALHDWAFQSAYHHNTGGLAGVPAPALANPGLGNTRLANPSANFKAEVANNFRFNTFFDRDEMARSLGQSPAFRDVLIEVAQSNPRALREALNS